MKKRQNMFFKKKEGAGGRLWSRGGVMLFGIVLIAAFAGALSGVHAFTDASSFCARCHRDHGEQWAASTHKTINCVDCHVNPGFNGLIQSKLDGIRRIFVTIKQGVDVERGKAPLPISTKNCMGCHNGILRFNEMGYEDLPDNSLKVDGLVMGHRIHVEKHNIDCVWCHRGTVHRDPKIVGKYEYNMPLHGDCAVCHNGERLEVYNVTLPHQEDKAHCTMCHPTYEPPPEGQY